MSELAVSIGVIVAPIAWYAYQRRRAQKQREALLAELEREQSQHAPQPTSPLIPNATSTDPSLQLQQQPGKESLTPTLKFILVCLIIHELWIAWEMYYDRPTNIFTTLNMPITTLVSKLRREILEALGTQDLPSHLEFLLSRLQSFDARTYYVRFGHHVVTTCTWCQSYNDYVLYYIVNVTLEYLRTSMLVTIMTMKGSGKRKWRTWTLAAVFGFLVAECWTIIMMNMVIPRVGTECEMWADRYFYLRHATFLIIPAILHFLPYTYLPLSPFRPLGPVGLLLSRINERLALVSVIQASSQRHPVLLQRRSEYWRNQTEEANWARDDEDVMKEAERLNLGYGVGNSDGDQAIPIGALRGQVRGRVFGMRQMLDNVRPIMAQPNAEPVTNGGEARDSGATVPTTTRQF
ncbi:hypothetical protein FRB94_007686 [Tulasnella sp. JGI-2019a]|nr:hypothetical protein FRB94_007686 [Tulasnella sp. JGI-2019a]KAG9001245.1 hypothetical protein FRB93_012171 [Tulasnella sp. JGI-2019a]KAG9026370.1 hypothetical protein FRB95_008909 [Tulasnella sp. JGI-2019a]